MMHKLLKNTIQFVAGAAKNHALHKQHLKQMSSGNRRRMVLGIETSCDDTGAAIVDEDGTIIGEAIHSQTPLHVEMGGIIPPLARDLHKEHIHQVVEKALNNANLTVHDVDAIATTVKPGLIMSLDIGMKYTKTLIEESQKPFIPIHHMEAHALTARMIEHVEFPFLVLLMSGGHCLLAVARDIDDFLVLGRSLDVAPGDSFDKVARALRLKDIEECSGLSGGASIELMARTGDPSSYSMMPPMHGHKNCHFSFSSARTKYEKLIAEKEAEIGLGGSNVLPDVSDICASFQNFILRHLVNRLRRAILYCQSYDLMSVDNSTLVISGGVASNLFLRRGLQVVCEAHRTRLVCPPPHLCTDNGIMVAWNGIEKLISDRGFQDVNDVNIQAKCPLGRDISQDVAKATISFPRLKVS